MGMVTEMVAKAADSAIAAHAAKKAAIAEKRAIMFGGVTTSFLDESQKKCWFYISDCIEGKGGSFGSGSSGVSNEEFDKIVLDKIESMQLLERSMQMLNIDSDLIKEIESICISNYSGDLDFSFPGKDGLFRNRYYSTIYIHFGEYQLYVYSCEIDLLTSEKTEKTREFFYKDITNVEKSIDVYEWENKIKSGCLGSDISVKKIGVYRGFSVYVPNSKYSTSTIFRPGIDESIDGMIAKIRDKKNR